MPKLKFEETLTRLEQVVRKLEAGDTSLEESLDLFETGIQLAKICNQKLDAAEAKIEQLTKVNGELMKEPFSLEEKSNVT